ncbi:MAG: acylphosphatase [Nanoarchaeota archaeon]|nr:acylphosphatase [Nanoarchaeota archaeon]
MTVRMVVSVRGLVQRAGFRDFVQQQAYRHRVRGTVQNEADGSVRIVAEAADPVLQKFLMAVREVPPPVEIEDLSSTKEKATGEFTDFTVLWSGNEGILEKLDVGFRYVKEMNQDLGAKMDTVGEKVDVVGKDVRGVGDKVNAVAKEVRGVGEKVDAARTEIQAVGTKVDAVGTDVRGVGTKVDNLTQQTARHFDTLDRNYGKISKTLEAALQELRDEHRQSSKDMQQLIKAVVASGGRRR